MLECWSDGWSARLGFVLGTFLLLAKHSLRQKVQYRTSKTIDFQKLTVKLPFTFHFLASLFANFSLSLLPLSKERGRKWLVSEYYPPPSASAQRGGSLSFFSRPKRFSISLRAVCVALGLLLIVSAILKAHELLVEPFASRPSMLAPNLRAGWVVFEAAFGSWLIGGAFPTATRYFAATLFAVLGAISWIMFFRGRNRLWMFRRD